MLARLAVRLAATTRTGLHRSTSAVDGALQVGVGRRFAASVLERVLALDAAAVELVLRLRHPLLTKFMTSVTGIGSAASVALFLGVFALVGWRRELAISALALSVCGLVVVSLMAAVQRPFPPQPVCQTAGEMTPHSFPSGHAAAVTVYSFVARRSDRLPFAAVAALAAVIAFSRIYLGTHYLSDTVAGVLIGVGSFYLARTALDRFGDRAQSIHTRVR